MNVLREDKRLEAIKRMKKMNLFAPAIKQFAEDHLVMVSDWRSLLAKHRAKGNGGCL